MPAVRDGSGTPFRSSPHMTSRRTGSTETTRRALTPMGHPHSHRHSTEAWRSPTLNPKRLEHRHPSTRRLRRAECISSLQGEKKYILRHAGSGEQNVFLLSRESAGCKLNNGIHAFDTTSEAVLTPRPAAPPQNPSATANSPGPACRDG